MQFLSHRLFLIRQAVERRQALDLDFEVAPEPQELPRYSRIGQDEPELYFEEAS
jgi:hypothetical protein